MNLSSKAKNFWIDERGFIISAELVIIATILVLGLIVGLSSVQTAIVGELFDISQAFCSLNQNYYIRGFRGCKSFTGSSAFFGSRLCGTCAAGGFNDFGGGDLGGGFIGGGGSYGGGMGGGVYGGSSSTVVVPPAVSAPSGSSVIHSAPQSGPVLCPPPAATAPCNECLTAPGVSTKMGTPVLPKSSVEPAPMMAPGADQKK